MRHATLWARFQRLTGESVHASRNFLYSTPADCRTPAALAADSGVHGQRVHRDALVRDVVAAPRAALPSPDAVLGLDVPDGDGDEGELSHVSKVANRANWADAVPAVGRVGASGDGLTPLTWRPVGRVRDDVVELATPSLYAAFARAMGRGTPPVGLVLARLTFAVRLAELPTAQRRDHRRAGFQILGEALLTSVDAATPTLSPTDPLRPQGASNAVHDLRLVQCRPANRRSLALATRTDA